MNLSNKDRVLLINQYRILAAVDSGNGDHYQELITILERGFEIFYFKIDEWLWDEMPSEDGKLVLDILDIYRSIEDLKRTTKDEELLSHRYSYFMGFDGNNETEFMAFARFLIDDQGKYSEQQQYFQKNDHLNSHMPMIGKYRRMIQQSKKLDGIFPLSIEKAIEILNA